jgi:hypothetical protein
MASSLAFANRLSSGDSRAGEDFSLRKTNHFQRDGSAGEISGCFADN